MNAPLPVMSKGVPGVTIVTQTRVRDADRDAFAQFQATISETIRNQPGFIDQSVLPPDPPVQTDWVILQRFRSTDEAVAWLHSDRRLTLLAGVQSMLTGIDDVHLVRDMDSGALPAPVSVVITTRVRPGCEAEFRRWEQRIAAAQARAPGFKGYRFEPPIPGVQEDYVAILRFDAEASLQGWMDSPERQRLLQASEAFTEQVQARVVRSGFAQWFAPQGAARAPAWKQNMIVLLLLYPVVFLFGLWVQAPFLTRLAGLPFWLSLFIGNIVSVLLLNRLVPLVSGWFGWWLTPATENAGRSNKAGLALILLLYAALLAVFSRLA